MNTTTIGGDTGFVEAVKNHCPWITPSFFKGVDLMAVKVCMESKIWRLRGFQGLPPTFHLEEIEQFLQG